MFAIDIAGGENLTGVVGQRFKDFAYNLLAFVQFGQLVGVVVAFGEASIQLRMPAMGGVAPQVVDASIAYGGVEKRPLIVGSDLPKLNKTILNYVFRLLYITIKIIERKRRAKLCSSA